jgi:hypothetical protein
VLGVCLGLGLNGIMTCEVIQEAGQGGVLRSGRAPEIVVTTSVIGAMSKRVKITDENIYLAAENQVTKVFLRGLIYP